MAAALHINPNSNPRRSIVKAVSWRILGSLDTAFWGWFFTGSLKIAGSIATFPVDRSVLRTVDADDRRRVPDRIRQPPEGQHWVGVGRRLGADRAT